MEERLSEIVRSCKYLVLDFDGVLADSEPLYRRSWNEALAGIGHSVDEEDYWLYWSSLGQGLEGELARTGLRVDGDEKARLRERQKGVYATLCGNGEVPMARGAGRLLRSLNEGRTGLLGWAIASNTRSGLVRTVLNRAGMPVPGLLVGGEGLRRKPAPDIFLRAASLLEASPEECLVAEDSIKGIRAARAGGFPVLRVLNDQNRGHSAPADAEVEDLDVLADALNEWKDRRDA